MCPNPAFAGTRRGGRRVTRASVAARPSTWAVRRHEEPRWYLNSASQPGDQTGFMGLDMRKASLRILGFFLCALIAYYAVFQGLLWLFQFRAPTGWGFSGSSSGLAVNSALASFLSLVASVFSLIGFLSATMLAWRKEKREVVSYRIDGQKKELEIAKLKLELERLTAKSNSEPAQQQEAPAASKTGQGAEPRPAG